MKKDSAGGSNYSNKKFQRFGNSVGIVELPVIVSALFRDYQSAGVYELIRPHIMSISVRVGNVASQNQQSDQYWKY